MKKVKDDPKLDTGCVKLYLDDISSIVESMQEINKDGKVEITVGGYQFPNIESLSELKQKEHKEISISYETKSPYARISFWVTKKNTHLSYYQSDNSLAFKGAFANIEKIILKSRRKWDWVELFFYLSMSLGTSVSLLLLQGKVDKNPTMTNIGFGIAGIMLISLAMYLFTIPIRVSQIILVEKIEHNTFWKRNKDTILISSISSVVSFLLGVLGTLFVQSLGK
jgi:hypothetical protein